MSCIMTSAIYYFKLFPYSHLKPVNIGPDLVHDPGGVLAGSVGQSGQVGVGAGTDVGVDRVHTCSLHPDQHLKVVLS